MKVRFCQFCGFELPDNAAFCPSCGKALPTAAATPPAPAQGTVQMPRQTHGTAQIPQQAPRQTYTNASDVINPQAAPTVTKKQVNLKLIAVIALLVVLLISGIFRSITKTRPLTLNSGDPIEIYVGDEQEIGLDGEGLTEAEYATAVWSVGNSSVLTMENGTIKASYDSNYFNEVADANGEGSYSVSCTTNVNAVVKKGIRTWEGSIPVTVKLKPVEIEGGKLLKKPADSCISTLTVKPSKNYSAYIYLQSKSKKANDMSFVVNKGEEVTVDVPGDHYIMYMASGNTWYGPEYMFGPQTKREKNEEEWDFMKYTWTLTLDAINGNLKSEDVNEDDFPDL